MIQLAMRVWTKNDEYTTKSIDHLIKKCLKILNSTPKEFWNNKEIPLATVRWIFLLGLDDFYKKLISLDDISTLAGDLYWPNDRNKWKGPSDFDKFDSKLGDILDWTSELTYYNWKKDASKENNKIRKSILKDMKEYYEKNKHIIKSIIDK